MFNIPGVFAFNKRIDGNLNQYELLWGYLLLLAELQLQEGKEISKYRPGCCQWQWDRLCGHNYMTVIIIICENRSYLSLHVIHRFIADEAQLLDQEISLAISNKRHAF